MNEQITAVLGFFRSHLEFMQLVCKTPVTEPPNGVSDNTLVFQSFLSECSDCKYSLWQLTVALNEQCSEALLDNFRHAVLLKYLDDRKPGISNHFWSLRSLLCYNPEVARTIYGYIPILTVIAKEWQRFYEREQRLSSAMSSKSLSFSDFQAFNADDDASSDDSTESDDSTASSDSTASHESPSYFITESSLRPWYGVDDTEVDLVLSDSDSEDECDSVLRGMLSP